MVLGHGLGIEDLLLPRRDAILRIARRHGATNVRVFGSVRRREARSDSDVDLLVDWPHGSDQVPLMTDLQLLLGRRVDVATPSRLWWGAAPNVLAEAIPL